MTLADYFENVEGVGVLATADDEGVVDTAIYARPHVMEDDTLAMIMRDRLSHANLQKNPHAAYLFIESGGGYKGKRLFLTKIREQEGGELLEALKRKSVSPEEDAQKGPKYLVFFRIDKELPLVGGGKE